MRCWGRYIRLLAGNDVLVHFKSLDSGEMNGLVTSVVYRNPEFRQQWLFKAIGMGAEGRTAYDLVDECQVCGPVDVCISCKHKDRTRHFFVCYYLCTCVSSGTDELFDAGNSRRPERVYTAC